jgi:predicted O-methyltransferase YrrM
VARDSNISFYHCTSDDYFEHYANQKFDFIYVDGDHRYSQQMRDYTNALNRLNEDGVIGGHDWSWPSTQQVITDMDFDKCPILHFADDSFLIIPESLL